jgi:dGTPase
VAEREARFASESRKDFRTPAQVDRDRILYSRHFQRLAEVTQVVSADRGYVFHNRLTHSLKVAQLARRIAEKIQKEQSNEAGRIGGIDPDAAEAAALGHDLGHPPFGHIAEEELDKLAKKAGLRDGFNGNAQSFRIVTTLAIGDAVASDTGRPVSRGLNLTRRTLDGILKYPWKHGQNSQERKKWGSYTSEAAVFEWVRKGYVRGSYKRSVEAELMDWADDITYAVHDLVDFYCAGQIPLDRLADQNTSQERDRFLKKVFLHRKELTSRRGSLEKAFSRVIEFFAAIDRPHDGSLKQKHDLWQLTTILISQFVRAIRLSNSRKKIESVVICDFNAKEEILMLKELTWQYVILRPELAAQQYGQQQAIQTVFSALLKNSQRDQRQILFPLEYKEELDLAKGNAGRRKRIVTDFVASMSEGELMRMYRSLRGRS